MEEFLSERERAEYEEFKRTRREREVGLMLERLLLDASRRETDKYALTSVCSSARKMKAACVVVSPVNVSAARRKLGESDVLISCIAGGTGESLISVKKTEAKRAVRQGAREIRLVPCYSALFDGNFSYLKREIRRVKRVVKKCALVYSLDDKSLSGDEIELGIKAACEGKADAVSVKGEPETVMLALRASAGRVRVDVSAIENAEQLRHLVKAGASRGLTRFADEIEKELHRFADEESVVVFPDKKVSSAIRDSGAEKT